MVLSINPPIRGSIVKFMITVERIKGINPPIRGSIVDTDSKKRKETLQIIVPIPL